MSRSRCISAPQLGLNMHPKWLRGAAPEDFLLPLCEIGLRVLEFHPDPRSPEWPEVDALIEACRAMGFRVSFHAPHKGPYQVTGFLGPERKRIERLFEPIIDYAAVVAGEDGPTPLVVHGAKGAGDREALWRNTEAFLRWIQDRAPKLRPALELRIREPTVTKVGDSKRDLLAFVSESGVSGVGICWDIGHDARNGTAAAPAGFVEQVTHAHVHDLSPEGEDHYPLMFGNAPYRDALKHLREVQYEGALILEINGHFVGRVARKEGIPATDVLRRSFEEMVEAFARYRSNNHKIRS